MVDPSVVTGHEDGGSGHEQAAKVAAKFGAKKAGVWIEDNDPNLVSKLINLKGFSPEGAAKVAAAVKAKMTVASTQSK